MDIAFLTGSAHLGILAFLAFYIFIIRKRHWGDWIYIYYSFAVLLSWTLLNGECAVTYALKCLQKNKCIAGKEVYEENDLYILPVSVFWQKRIVDLLFVFWWYSLYHVFGRNRISSSISIAFIGAWAFYRILLELNTNYYKNSTFQIWQALVFILTSVLLLLVVTARI